MDVTAVVLRIDHVVGCREDGCVVGDRPRGALLHHRLESASQGPCLCGRLVVTGAAVVAEIPGACGQSSGF